MSSCVPVLVTGGAGFIGQNLVHRLAHSRPEAPILVVDALTYAANPASLKPLIDTGRVTFAHADITNGALMSELLFEHSIDYIVHLAAESHVDRSIVSPDAFFRTNIAGTYELLKAARLNWSGREERCRFLHVSTDEVFGDLDDNAAPFSENTAYQPSSPYSASKAASDHLVRAFGRTYDMPVLVTNCSNNYGPYQHPEKLIPLTILSCLRGLPIPVYGNGKNIRDWLFVEDHCAALEAVLQGGKVGETYCVGGGAERQNIEVVNTICETIDANFLEAPSLADIWPDCPAAKGIQCSGLITFVSDRPGHDRRYAIDSTKLTRELGIVPSETFDSGIARTVRWYIENSGWCQMALDSNFSEWIASHYSNNSKTLPPEGYSS